MKAAKELIRRQTQERLRYLKLSEPPYNDQLGFYTSPADVRFGLGGNRSGKTEVGAKDSLDFSLGQHPVRSKHKQPPVHGRVVAPKYEDGCKGVVLKKFRELIPHHELHGSTWTSAWSEKSKMLYFANGSTINFKSAEMDLNTFGGVDLDFVWEDEHIPWAYFIENRARLVDRRGYHIKTMTPEAGQTWEEDFILNPPPGLTVAHWFFDTERNPFISAEGVAQLKASIRDPRLADAKLHGKFVALSGMVYPMWDASRVICPDFDIPREWERHCLIDPHLRKFTAIMWTAWSPDGDQIIYRTHKVKMVIDDLVNFIRAQSAGERITTWIGDEAMGGDGKNIFGENSVLMQLNQRGLPFIPTNQASDKAFEAGINKCQTFITPDRVSGKCRTRIFESCQRAVEYIDGKLTGDIFWEFKRYRFRKEQKSDEETFREKVATVDDDYLDLWRYDIMAGPSGSESDLITTNDIYVERDEFTGW